MNADLRNMFSTYKNVVKVNNKSYRWPQDFSYNVPDFQNLFSSKLKTKSKQENLRTSLVKFYIILYLNIFFFPFMP